MKDRSPLAASCLEVAGYIQFPLGVLTSLTVLISNSEWSAAIAVLALVLSVASASLALLSGRWLRKGQTRGWVAGIVLSGLYFFLVVFATGSTDALGLAIEGNTRPVSP